MHNSVREIKTQIPSRPVEAYTDQELMAKVSGAPLSVAEDVLIAYEGNLACEWQEFNSQADAERSTGIGEVQIGEDYRGV